MTFDISAFRTAFPAFADSNAYPDATIQGWSDLATNSPMGNYYAAATLAEQQLLVAHIGTLLSNAQTNGAGGGVMVSAGQGSVSASFATPPVKTGFEYYLARTVYGQQLWAMLNISSAGGLYTGGLPERSAFRKVGGVFC